MVESSFPPSRVGAAAIPDSIFLMRQRMIPLEMPDADSAVPQSPVSGNVPSAGSLWRVPGPEALLVSEGCPSGSRSYPPALYVPWPAWRQSIQYPADRAVVHSGSPYPSPCRGIWGTEAALRSLSQRATPAALMLAAASPQEERHRLGCLLSPLGGGPLHPDWRPRDMNCGAGPRRQVTLIGPMVPPLQPPLDRAPLLPGPLPGPRQVAP